MSANTLPLSANRNLASDYNALTLEYVRLETAVYHAISQLEVAEPALALATLTMAVNARKAVSRA